MKLTGKQLKKIIKEASDMHAIGSDPSSQGPMEYSLISAIATAWEKYTLGQNFEGTYDSWPEEVDKAAAALEDALYNDESVLSSILGVIERIDDQLHGGEYAPNSSDTDEYRETFTGHWRD